MKKYLAVTPGLALLVALSACSGRSMQNMEGFWTYKSSKSSSGAQGVLKTTSLTLEVMPDAAHLTIAKVLKVPAKRTGQSGTKLDFGEPARGKIDMELLGTENKDTLFVSFTDADKNKWEITFVRAPKPADPDSDEADDAKKVGPPGGIPGPLYSGPDFPPTSGPYGAYAPETPGVPAAADLVGVWKFSSVITNDADRKDITATFAKDEIEWKRTGEAEIRRNVGQPSEQKLRAMYLGGNLLTERHEFNLIVTPDSGRLVDSELTFSGSLDRDRQAVIIKLKRK